MWLWVTFFARFSLFFLFFLHWLLDWLLVFDFVACSSGKFQPWHWVGVSLAVAFVLLSASCYLLFANLRCLFTIIQSIIQFNARFVSPGVAIYSIIHSVTFEKGAICVFSQLLFTVFFFFYSAVRIFFCSVLYTSSSSFTGPQMRQKFSCLCLYASVCVLMCVVTCGELTDAANISEFTRILCTFSSFKTVSNRAAAALLQPLPLLLLLFLASSVVKIDGLIRPVGCLCGRWRSFRGDKPASFPFMARICALSTTTDVSQHYQKIIDWQTKARIMNFAYASKFYLYA